jgi:DNA ligase (NAD+)
MTDQKIQQFFHRNEVPTYLDGNEKCNVGATQTNLKKTIKALESGNYGRAKFLIKEGITEADANKLLQAFINMDQDVLPRSMIKKVNKLLKIADHFYSNQQIQLITNDDLYQSAVAKLQAIKGGEVEMGFVAPTRMDGKAAKHVFVTLGGTIDKIFGVKENDNSHDSGKKSFEWFVERPFKDGLREKGDEITVLASYKIDGIPIEAAIDTESGKITSAITRGDEDAGIDLTELYEDRRFDGLDNHFSDSEIGVKFEQILTFKNLEKLSNEKDCEYRNVRNGLGAILRDKKGKKYAHLIGLIPLELESKTFGGTKPDALDILSEISDFGLEYTVLSGLKKDLLNEFDEFQQKVLKLRPDLPYQIDGIVVEYLDSDLRKFYGRKNRTWDYQRAFKFPSSEQTTILKDVEYGIGHTGKVSFTAVYEPVDFGVCINDRASLGSFNRFRELDLHKGDKLVIGYNNDVIPYVKGNLSKKDKERGVRITMSDKCPDCGTILQLNENENDLFCPNTECTSVIIGKLVNFLNRLGAKDINDKTVRKLFHAGLVKEFSDFFTLTEKDFEKLEKVKEKAANRLLKAIKDVQENEITEANLVYALSLNDVGKETTELILGKYSLSEILSDNFDFGKLSDMEGLGEKKIKRFKKIRECKEIINQLCGILKVKTHLGGKPAMGKIVVFSGFRDKDFEKQLSNQGYTVAETVTKATKVLFVRDEKSESNKIKKAKELNIPIIQYNEGPMGDSIAFAALLGMALFG